MDTTYTHTAPMRSIDVECIQIRIRFLYHLEFKFTLLSLYPIDTPTEITPPHWRILLNHRRISQFSLSIWNYTLPLMYDGTVCRVEIDFLNVKFVYPRWIRKARLALQKLHRNHLGSYLQHYHVFVISYATVFLR